MKGLVLTFLFAKGYDAPAHMTEELKNARKEAPRAIVLAVYVGAFTGFIVSFLLSIELTENRLLTIMPLFPNFRL